MECPTCGEVVDDADAFCKHCGGRLGEEEPVRSRAVSDLALEYRNVLNDAPDDVDALYNVGLAELYSGKLGAAEECFRRVVQLLPDDFAGHEKMAVCLAKLGRREKALQFARRACELDPERESIRRILKALGG